MTFPLNFLRKGAKRRKQIDRLQNKNGDAGSNGHFNVPRNLELQLETAKVTKTDICQLRFYAEYQWLVDFALYTLIVYGLTEVTGGVNV
jgi:hypothetical protein